MTQKDIREQEDIKEKVLKGGQLAIQRLIERKRRDDGYIVISKNGKALRIKARDLKS